MNLEELGKTVNPARGITSAVLSLYGQIHGARQMMWDWQTIADAMEMPGKAAQIRQAFTRVKAGLKSGEIALPARKPKIDTSGKRPQASASVKNAAIKPAPGQPVDWEALVKQRKKEEDEVEWTG